ncbi:hypothetical protein [Sorangium sp. So ce1000]|uniref:hypothetical protein n=1 Tax=Sorangium sp. So ce1000 TaxID=3133325 RepID=UPI003F5E126D
MSIQLFLARADDHQPILADGFPQSSAYGAPKPGFNAPDPSHLANRSAAADALPEQRWGLVVPRGPAGDRLLQLVEPLKRKREADQGGPAVVYRVDSGMSCGQATRWIQRDYWDAVDRRVDELPRYLLLLGDADVVSWEFQQMLGSEAFVGRLAFADERGYEAYVEKVLRWESQEPVPGARALFYTVRDGTRATAEGYRHLVAPTLQFTRDCALRGRFPATEIREIGGGDGVFSDEELHDLAQEMLREAQRTQAGLLFSVSHGAGAPRQGWRTPEEQRAHQGAAVLGGSGDRLTVQDVEKHPFLPGGLWFFFACFGAGTPARSAYYHWLDQLYRLGRSSRAERVLASLPGQNARPFVAALPQAALANLNGPLGIIGHVDLAWTWSFLDSAVANDDPSASRTTRRRAERFQGVFRSLVHGHRLGVAHNEITHFFCTLDTELATSYDEDAEPAAAARASDEAREARRAGVWMQRQDLCAYVLLGDPAARLPIARRPDGVLWRPPGERGPALARNMPSVMGFEADTPARRALAGARDAQSMEDAVLAVFRGGDERAIAAQRGLDPSELRRWLDAFMRAGRAALRQIR